MSIFWKRHGKVCFFLTIFVVGICTVGSSGTVYPKSVHSKKKTVAVDPGHGGHDEGARGLDGMLEKSVALKLAKMLAAKLENTYEVILTRSDDYKIDDYARTAVANHADADVFISLHMGGSFLHQANNASIYYYKQLSDQNAELENFPNRPSVGQSEQLYWADIHNRYRNSSRSLAKKIQQELEKDPMFSDIEIKGAPLMVLEGADMPAVLIEPGYLTNPNLEKLIKDPLVLSGLVKEIKAGIDAFFKAGTHSAITE
jgi:N-acetylmuramoyl-L-alanine amidase